MEALMDWTRDNAVNHELLKEFLLAWCHYDRLPSFIEAPDLVMVTGLLKAVGFGVTKVERMEGEAFAPGMVNGCTVDIQCPVSRIKITLSAPDAVCNCQRDLGMVNLNPSQMKMRIAMPQELPPEKSLMVRTCLNSLMSIIWPKTDHKVPIYSKRVDSLDSFHEFEDDSGIESSSLLSIDSKSEDSMMSSSLTSAPNSPCTKSKLASSLRTPVTSKPYKATSGKGGKKGDHHLTLPTPVGRFQPSPNSPYWESSTYRGKQYVEMVKQREAEKKKGK